MTAEIRVAHSRLLKCTLEAENARAYWRRATGMVPTTQQAFEACWFGARTLPRVEVLLFNFRARFGAFPKAQGVLHRWPEMPAETRAVICHWHVQLADPLYRAFTGRFLVERRESARPAVTRDLVFAWVTAEGPPAWTLTTRIEYASKLLSTAYAAGLVATNRDPRPLRLPRISDDALSYVLYLLRTVDFDGTILDNPYLTSVGLAGETLDARLRQIPSLSFRRMGDLVDLTWQYPSLTAWADHALGSPA